MFTLAFIPHYVQVTYKSHNTYYHIFHGFEITQFQTLASIFKRIIAPYTQYISMTGPLLYLFAHLLLVTMGLFTKSICTHYSLISAVNVGSLSFHVAGPYLKCPSRHGLPRRLNWLSVFLPYAPSCSRCLKCPMSTSALVSPCPS